MIDTAINGGSLEKGLRESLRTDLIDTAAAQGANAIGDLTATGALEDFTNKVAHAIASCAAGAARADNPSGCGAGAIGAAVGELSAEAYGRRADTVQFASLMSGIAAAIAGGEVAQINVASQAGGNAAANNFLGHADALRLRSLTAQCKAACTPAQREELAALLAQDSSTTAALDSCAGVRNAACDSVRKDFENAAATFTPQDQDIWAWACKQSDASGGRSR